MFDLNLVQNNFLFEYGGSIRNPPGCLVDMWSQGHFIQLSAKSWLVLSVNSWLKPSSVL